MTSHSIQKLPKFLRTHLPLALALAGAAFMFTACSKSPSQQTAQAGQPANAKVYHLHGKVLSVDQANSSMMIDGDEIPGFMGAMAMPYPVKAKADLTKAGPGDEITADVIVPGDDPAYIQNIVVVKKGTASATPAPGSSQRDPQPGDAVPDFALINQDGKRVHLSSYRGDALLVTFIYTRCPFPDFCPLVSKNFAHVYADTQSSPALKSHLHLLSVSFDPDHDTPQVLRDYAKTFDATTGGSPFSRWEFTVVPKNDLAKVTEFFGVTIANDKGQYVHSMSTSVIGPDGKIYSWHEDTDWKPAELIADATAALDPSAKTTAANLRNAGREIPAPASAN